MDANLGQKWWKQRVPEKAKEDFSLSWERELKLGWQRLVPLHPLYYTSFSALRTIIERRDNWDECFSSVFIDKARLVSLLEQAEPARNKVAHNRPVTALDTASAENASNYVRVCLTDERFDDCISRFGQFPQIYDIFEKFSEWCVSAASSVSRSTTAELFSYHQDISNSWWWDEEYLGFPIDDLDSSIELVRQYNELPRNRGDGHLVQQWVETNRIEHSLKSAVTMVRENVLGDS